MYPGISPVLGWPNFAGRTHYPYLECRASPVSSDKFASITISIHDRCTCSYYLVISSFTSIEKNVSQLKLVILNNFHRSQVAHCFRHWVNCSDLNCFRHEIICVNFHPKKCAFWWSQVYIWQCRYLRRYSIWRKQRTFIEALSTYTSILNSA